MVRAGRSTTSCPTKWRPHQPIWSISARRKTRDESSISDGAGRGTLHLVHLESDTVSATIENVERYETHHPRSGDETTNHLAYVQHDVETGRDTLNIVALGRTSGWGYRGTYEGWTIDGLCWARDAIMLGFVIRTQKVGADGRAGVGRALHTWHVAGPNVQGNFARVGTHD